MKSQTIGLFLEIFPRSPPSISDLLLLFCKEVDIARKAILEIKPLGYLLALGDEFQKMGRIACKNQVVMIEFNS